MKQQFCILALFAILTGTFYSCSDTKTYAEQLAEERASINTFMKIRGYTVTSVIPTAVPWPDKVFYKTKSGMYVHVIDKGDFVDTIPGNTPINVRYMEVSMDDDTTYSNMTSSEKPFVILYNNVSSSTNFGDCLAWHEALDYVGERGHVLIIVPADIGFKYYTTSSALTARFYELRYKFWD